MIVVLLVDLNNTSTLLEFKNINHCRPFYLAEWCVPNIAKGLAFRGENKFYSVVQSGTISLTQVLQGQKKNFSMVLNANVCWLSIIVSGFVKLD